MTTDTAVRVTRICVQDKGTSLIAVEISARCKVLTKPVPVDKIPYVDHPELKINKHESTQMPFRYVKSEDGQPIMPAVCA
jgi:ribosome biogenesis SPOUT family RNA methylase Rps3